MSNIGLILSGGGARAAYQVGVLKGIAELVPNHRGNPFNIVCGTSAGAINAAKLATEADQFHDSITRLYELWANLHSGMVHEVGFSQLLLACWRLIGSFLHSGIARGRPLALLNNQPLGQFLREHIDMHRLPQMITSGHLRALSIAALGYASGQSICFFQGDESIRPWHRAQRIGTPTELTHDHLMASSALPAIFPPVKINREYFGDGAIRQTAPMSAALHLGADKLLVIGVSGNRYFGDERKYTDHSPSLAQIMGQLLNSAFIDAVEEDIEMLERFNTFIRLLSVEKQKELKVRPVDVLTINPTTKFDEMAANHVHALPLSMRVFLKTIGATRSGGGSSLASYVLFEKEYCKALMAIGYSDALEQEVKIREFLEL